MAIAEQDTGPLNAAQEQKVNKTKLITENLGNGVVRLMYQEGEPGTFAVLRIAPQEKAIKRSA